jgi:predicted DNA-binding mobile mystery protein A
MKLIIKQLDSYFKTASKIQNTNIPKGGWVKSIRQAIGMSTTQLAKKLDITRQSVTEIEQREASGTITLNTLSDTANAMDLQLFYILIPKDGSLELLIDRKANELATIIVSRTSHSMKLEGQENSPKKIKENIVQRTNQIKNESLKNLWN